MGKYEDLETLIDFSLSLSNAKVINSFITRKNNTFFPITNGIMEEASWAFYKKSYRVRHCNEE